MYMYMSTNKNNVFIPISIEFSFRHLKLSAEQKCDIAQRELEELRDEIEKLKDESEKILDNFRVSHKVVDVIYLKENSDEFCYSHGVICNNYFCVFYCQAVMEEADIRSAEVKKASYEFERDIVKGAVNQVLCEKNTQFAHFKESEMQISCVQAQLPAFLSGSGQLYTG